jgi:hypothetical protein
MREKSLKKKGGFWEYAESTNPATPHFASVEG